MIYSNKRKLTLCGWLESNNKAEYCSPLKLQKFLLLYELFSKVDGEPADFNRLCGYKHGPVFSTVFGDYTHDRTEFDCAVQSNYSSNKSIINEDRAKRSAFIVESLSEDELSELSHKLNLWRSKYSEIRHGIRQVDLDEDDFNDDDMVIIKTLESMYPMSLVENSVIISVNAKNFVFDKDAVRRLSIQNIDTLGILSTYEDLMNPVYVSIDEEGRLIVD